MKPISEQLAKFRAKAAALREAMLPPPPPPKNDLSDFIAACFEEPPAAPTKLEIYEAALFAISQTQSASAEVRRIALQAQKALEEGRGK